MKKDRLHVQNQDVSRGRQHHKAGSAAVWGLAVLTEQVVAVCRRRPSKERSGVQSICWARLSFLERRTHLKVG